MLIKVAFRNTVYICLAVWAFSPGASVAATTAEGCDQSRLADWLRQPPGSRDIISPRAPAGDVTGSIYQPSLPHFDRRSR